MDSLGLITPHFHASEFAQPERHGYAALPYPAPWHDRLLALCQVLECIRLETAGPLIITSGYRSRAYNRAIGGARLSQHVEGRAADMQTDRLPPADLYALILALIKHDGLPVGGLGLYPHFVHVDIRPGDFVTWRGSRTQQ